MTGDDVPSGEDPYGLDVPRGAVKEFFAGTHRLIAPGQTLRQMRPLMPVMGITRLANLTGLDTVGLPVVMAVRPNARSLAVSSGKGLTIEAATASALMEAIELYHAERVRAPLRLGSLNDLRFSYPLCDVERLPRLSLGRFHSHWPLLWAEGFDLLARAPVWVPFELVHTNFTLPFPAGSGCFPITSNGLASGNHVLEAISHALSEVIERDAVALWHATPEHRRRERRIDLDSIADPSCCEALARVRAAGVAVGVWDVTSDVGVAAFECVLVDAHPNVFQHTYATSGTGCHPCRETALLRAVTEAAQGRLIYVSGSRDDRDRDAYAAASDPAFTARIRALIDDAPAAARPFDAVLSSSHDTFGGDVRWQVERLDAAGIEEVIVVDLTRAEFGVPVVRAIVSGLEGVDGAPGYVPGPRARAAAGAA